MNNKSALILGLGRSGKEAALFLKDQGTKVTVMELEKNFSTLRRKKKLEDCGVRVIFGPHQESLLDKKDLIVVSPGVPNHLPIINRAQSLRIPVISELELASRFIPREDIIAITGTNGKTTTTFLTYKILKKRGMAVKLGGNIGNPLCKVARELSSQHSSCRVVTEVSSFQLEKSDTFSPHIYCILNISPDHLDRHSSFLEYRRIKAIPLSRMSPDDFAILNYDQRPIRCLSEFISARVIFFSQRQKLNQGLFIANNNIVANIKNKVFHIPLENLQMENFHSPENLLCATGIALIEGVDIKTIYDSLVSYKPLPHRQQFIAQVAGVKFIDDSKATNQAAVENFIKSLSNSAILIMGGKDKGDDFSSLKKYFPGKVKSLMLIGEARGKIKKQLEGTVPIRQCEDLSKAIRLAFSLSRKKDSIVLCPGCSSFDEFKSYRHRGRVFKKEVEKLKKEVEGKKYI